MSVKFINVQRKLVLEEGVEPTFCLPRTGFLVQYIRLDQNRHTHGTDMEQIRLKNTETWVWELKL